MLSAILVNVLIGMGDLTGAGCLSSDCRGVRTLGPVVVGLGVIAVVTALGRLLGPVFVSPAIGSWLVTTPVDRAALLRPRVLVAMALVAATTGLVSAGAATLAGWSLAGGVLLAGATGLLGLGVFGLAVRVQGAPRGSTPRTVGLRGPGAVAWLLLLVLALGLGSRVAAPDPDARWYVALAACGLLALLGTTWAVRAVPLLHRRDVVRGAGLVPAVSGALATLDLSLAWDVVSEHRWRDHPAVRSRRGRWSGTGALVWADLARLRRSPGRVLRLAAAGVLPYAVQAAGAGRVVILVVALVGFLAGLPLLTGLRVLERSPGLVRLLPFTTRNARLAAMVVPVVGLVGFGLAMTPALPPGEGRPLLGLACGLVAAAAAVRWMTGRPPDYARPLVSTPAGGVPTNLYGSALRGFDVVLLGTAPLLLSPTPDGALVSVAVSAVVLAYLLGRD
ncbi:MAG: DUF6297 family protein [Nocardioides sp.]|nr:DUF6297 family protein [Nocardioides sp.]